MARLRGASKDGRNRWHGLRLLAADKTTLALPESPSLFKAFGSHSGKQGLGPIAVELCCLFDLITRAPLHYVYDKACTSEKKLIKKLVKYLKKGDLILMDAGFYCCTTFTKIVSRCAHFIIPAKTTNRPKVLSTLGQSDYLCQIQSSTDSSVTLIVRVLFVYRNGFRRRRLVTSLTDPIEYPASELARLYHMRWDIETFYRDFKHTLKSTSWHCQTLHTFRQELVMHMITICLIRIAMFEACCLIKSQVAQISFACALTETRLFFKILTNRSDTNYWNSIWTEFVQQCAKHRVKYKPDRQFSRDRQEYRRKSRGLNKPKRGRKRKYQAPSPLPPQSEIIKDSKGILFLLD